MYCANLVIFKVHIKQLRQTYHSASVCRILSKSDHQRQSYDVISFSRWRPRHRNSTSPFSFRDFAHPRRSKSTCILNFGEISQSTAEILLLPVSKKQTSAMLKFYFRFRFLRLRHHRHVILHLSTKFRPNRIISDRVMTSCPFSRWRPRPRNSTSGFGFRDFAHLRRSTSKCVPNFGQISQSTAEILLLPVSENKRPPC